MLTYFVRGGCSRKAVTTVTRIMEPRCNVPPGLFLGGLLVTGEVLVQSRHKASFWSISLASLIQVRASCAKCSLDCGVTEVCARRTHSKACLRHSLGSPGIVGLHLPVPFPLPLFRIKCSNRKRSQYGSSLGAQKYWNESSGPSVVEEWPIRSDIAGYVRENWGSAYGELNLDHGQSVP